MSEPIAYFITYSTYGTWLHGKTSGSVDPEHNEYGTPFLPANAEKESWIRSHLTQDPYYLDQKRRTIVLKTVIEVCEHRRWRLWAAHVRTNHVHIVASLPGSVDKAMQDLKSWCSRRLGEQLGEPADRKRWTEHGSTKYLWNEPQRSEKIDYTINRQGVMLSYFDGSQTHFERPVDSCEAVPGC